MPKKAVEPFYGDLGRRLHSARQVCGLTQEQLGRRLIPTMTRAAIANMESGKQRVLTHTLAQLADALAIAPGELLPAKARMQEPIISEDNNRLQQIRTELINKLGISSAEAQIITNKLKPAQEENKQ